MDTYPLRELHLFAGAGGGILAGMLLGHVPVCAVEINPFCQQRLIDRQREGYLPLFPIWDDVSTFDGHPWRGRVDIVSGGFPCQDISPAGKGAGITGSRSGLWTEFARVLGEVRPRYAFIENAATLTVRGLATILADLARLGLDARWCRLGADDVGAWHARKRTWILAYKQSQRLPESWGQSCASEPADGAAPSAATPNAASLRCDRLAAQSGSPCSCQEERRMQQSQGACLTPDPFGSRCDGRAPDERREAGRRTVIEGASESGVCHPYGASTHTHAPTSGSWDTASEPSRRQPEPDVGGLVYGLADGLGSAPWDVPDVFNAYGIPAVAERVPERTQRIMALGNGQVPLCAALAWRILGGP